MMNFKKFRSSLDVFPTTFYFKINFFFSRRVYLFHSEKPTQDSAQMIKFSPKRVKYSIYFSFKISDNSKPKLMSALLLYKK